MGCGRPPGGLPPPAERRRGGQGDVSHRWCKCVAIIRPALAKPMVTSSAGEDSMSDRPTDRGQGRKSGDHACRSACIALAHTRAVDRPMMARRWSMSTRPGPPKASREVARRTVRSLSRAFVASNRAPSSGWAARGRLNEAAVTRRPTTQPRASLSSRRSNEVVTRAGDVRGDVPCPRVTRRGTPLDHRVMFGVTLSERPRRPPA